MSRKSKLLLSTVILVLSQLLPVAVLGKDCVILLHGLGRTSNSLSDLENRLRNAGFDTANIDYPSRDQAVEQLAGSAVRRGIESCETTSPERIHFVTHSLGGILVRVYFSQENHPKLGRVVMLAPPNGGSEIVDSFGELPGFTAITGPAGQELGTDDTGIPSNLGPVRFELGVIAGDQSLNPIYSYIIPGEDDGKVSVANTRVQGMSQHVVLPVTHTWMMGNEEVIEQVVHFIQTGNFFAQDNEELTPFN